MNARRVNAAAGAILAAQKQRNTAAGIAMSLEAAGLLQSPESAAELEQLRAQTKAVPYVLGESKLPEGLREQLVALLAEVLRQGVPAAALTGGMHAQGEMEAALSGALARYLYPAPGLFPSVAEQVHQLRARVVELEAQLADTTEPDVDGAGRTYEEYHPRPVEDPHDSPLHHPYELSRDLDRAVEDLAAEGAESALLAKILGSDEDGAL